MDSPPMTDTLKTLRETLSLIAARLADEATTEMALAGAPSPTSDTCNWAADAILAALPDSQAGDAEDVLAVRPHSGNHMLLEPKWLRPVTPEERQTWEAQHGPA